MIYFFMISFHLFLFQNIISEYIVQFNFLDEFYFIILCICFIFMIMLRPKRKKYLSKNEINIIVLVLIFILWGLLANIRYKYQIQNIAVFKDILCISKFSISYVLLLMISSKLNKELLLKKISKCARIYVLMIFIFGIMNLFINVGMSSEKRYGIRSYKFLYSHPTYLVFYLVVLISILISEQKKRNNKFIIMSLISLIFTCRSKAIVFVFIYFFMNYVLKYKVKIKLSYVISISLIGLLLTYHKILEYFMLGYKAARPALYLTGIQILKNNFPFGSGFGTFASSLSGKYYSDIYNIYHLSNIWGMTRENYSYIADTFWPYIYGQFGFVGLIIFLCILFRIFISIYSRYKNSLNKFKAMILLVIYIIISSTSEAIFIDITGQFAFIVLAVFLGDNNLISCKKNNDKEIKNSYGECYSTSI